MARGGSGTFAVTWAMLVAAIGGVIGLVVVLRAVNPGSESKPPTASQTAPPPPPPPPPSASAAGPLAFRDPDSVKKWAQLRADYKTAKDAVADFPKAVSQASLGALSESLDQACAKVSTGVAWLAGEPHPEAVKFTNEARRTCDYERPLAVLRASLAELAKKPAPATKKSLCLLADGAAKLLTQKSYLDDETVKTELAKIGAACL